MSIWSDLPTRLERWARQDHDDKCEQRERSFICHCSLRRRIAAGRTELPTLEVPYPVCTGCDNPVDHDGDRFVCQVCRANWSQRAGDGDQAVEWSDDYGIDFGGEQFGPLLRDLADGGAA